MADEKPKDRKPRTKRTLEARANALREQIKAVHAKHDAANEKFRKRADRLEKKLSDLLAAAAAKAEAELAAVRAATGAGA